MHYKNCWLKDQD